MRFKCICTPHNFADEQLLRALDENARLTKSGKILGWYTRDDLDRIEMQGVEYTVLY